MTKTSKPKRTVAIVQSSYIPWRGYFDLIRAADVFILLDDVQFTRRDWRNRNRIKTAGGVEWLTIPVRSKSRFKQRIMETEIDRPDWAEKHWRSIRSAYARAPAREAFAARIESLFAAAGERTLLSDANEVLLRGLSRLLGIGTPIRRSTDILPLDVLDASDPSTRLARLAEAVGGTRYLSGPSATAYLDRAPFVARGIDVAFVSYSGYPAYPQLHGGAFEPALSVIDLLLNTGDAASECLIDLAADEQPEAATSIAGSRARPIVHADNPNGER